MDYLDSIIEKQLEKDMLENSYVKIVIAKYKSLKVALAAAEANSLSQTRFHHQTCAIHSLLLIFGLSEVEISKL